MSKIFEDEVQGRHEVPKYRGAQYYYDEHYTQEGLMGVTSSHADLVRYLMLVLQWLFRAQTCALYDNLNFYWSENLHESELDPDIAVNKGIEHRRVTSWHIGQDGPAPQVVFEIASRGTWENDLRGKPEKYARMGVHEYFSYDPNDPQVWTKTTRRLQGWRVNKRTGRYRELEPDRTGRLWSEELASWFVPDGDFLRICDRSGQVRLTGEEARELEAQLNAQEAEINARLAQIKAQEAQANARLAQINAQRAQKLAEKLRALGINPDE